MRIPRISLGFLSAGAIVALAAALGSGPDARGLRLGTAPVQSLGAMTFGPDGTLFIADATAGNLVALDVADRETASFTGRVLAANLDTRAAAVLGTTADRIRFHDMAVHPTTRSIYLTVSRIDGENAQPALLRVRGPEAIDIVDLDNIRHATTPIPGTPARTAQTPWGQPSWRLAVTDLAFSDGQLFVAGLSNEQFASALRRVPFPFGRSPAMSTVEIYHTSHDKWETAAPIEAFLPITIGGTPMIVAGYGCSPIATFARAALDGSRHVKGRTVAELGGGSRPIDMIRYQRDGKEMILIANSHRTLMRIDPADIAAAPELTRPVGAANEAAGVKYLAISSAGVMQIDDFDGERIAVLQREVETGAVNLTSMLKRWL